MKIDETELVEFFSALPDKQPDQEKEFFGTTSFTVHRSRTVLYLSFCEHDPEVMIRLMEEGSQTPIYSARHRDVDNVEVRTEPDGKQWLRVQSKHIVVLVRPDPIKIQVIERC